jgi:hypothetical protein
MTILRSDALRNVLQDEGFTMLEAGTAAEALAAVNVDS